MRNETPGFAFDTDSIPCQTTLPKARPLNINPSKYASLPGSMQPKNAIARNDSDLLMNNGRTKLGIDISAVHDAVLRGVAPIPEAMVNEHPVTIYPGRSSPVKSKSASNRIVVRSAHDLTDKTLKLTLHDESSDCEEGVTQGDSASGRFITSLRELLITCWPVSIQIFPYSIVCFISVNHIVAEDFKPLQQTVSLSNFEKNRQSLLPSEDDFSDDSLESAPLRDTSTEIIEIKLETKSEDDLTPPPPPPPEDLSPLMPDLTLPLTKCSPGIAWEIKLDDNIEMEKRGFKVCYQHNSNGWDTNCNCENWIFKKIIIMMIISYQRHQRFHPILLTVRTVWHQHRAIVF